MPIFDLLEIEYVVFLVILRCEITLFEESSMILVDAVAKLKELINFPFPSD